MAVLVTCGVCEREFRAKDQARNLTVKCPGCATHLTVDGPRVANHDVFVSYSHKDKSVADGICAALENRKVRCWMAPRDIAPGADWSSSIIEAIEDARVMLLVFSSNSNMSQQVLREVERAVSKALIVLPVRIENVDLSKSMEYFLSACHWIDAMAGPDPDALKGLVTQVKLMLLKGERALDVAGFHAGKPADVRLPKSARRAMAGMALATVCALAVSIGVGIYAFTRDRTAPVAPAPKAEPNSAVAMDSAKPPPVPTTADHGNSPTTQATILPAASAPPLTAAAASPAVAAPVSTTQYVNQLEGHPDSIAKIQFLPGDRLVALGAEDETHAVIWDLKTGSIVNQSNRTATTLYSPDGQWIFSPGSLTSTTTGKVIPIESASAHDRAVFSADGSRVAVGSHWKEGANSPVRVYECATGRELFETPPPNVPFATFDLSPNGHRIMVNGGVRALSVWDVDFGTEFPKNQWDYGPNIRGRFSADGSQLGAVLTAGGQVMTCDVATGKRLFVGQTPLDSDPDVRNIYVAANGFTMAWLNRADNSVGLFRPTEGNPVKGVLTNPNPPTCIPALSPDGTRMLVATTDCVVRLFDTGTDGQLYEFEGHTGKVNALAFNPDGKWAASGGDDKTVRLWKIPGPDPVLPAHQDQQNASSQWTPLFNGKDLTDWVVDGGHEENFRVDDGAILASGATAGTRSYLLSDRDFANFKLRLEFQAEPDASGAVALRAVPGERMPIRKQLIFDHPIFKIRGIADIREQTGTLFWVTDGVWVAPVRPADIKPAGSWNQLEIEVRGRSLTASINGAITNDVAIDDSARLTDGQLPALNREKGRIGIQSAGGTVRYRNIQIEDLP